MHYNDLPTKSLFLRIILNRESQYMIIRIIIIGIIYIFSFYLVIVAQEDTISLTNTLILALIILIGVIEYCYSNFIINEYVNSCKEQDISDDTLEKLKDEEDDIEGDIKIMAPFLSVVFGLIGSSIVGTGISKEKIIIVGTIFSFFILTAFVYPDKLFHNKLVKCIEGKKKKIVIKIY